MAPLPLYNQDVWAVVSRSCWTASSPSAWQVGRVRGGVGSGPVSIHWDPPQTCAQLSQMNFVWMSNESLRAGDCRAAYWNSAERWWMRDDALFWGNSLIVIGWAHTNKCLIPSRVTVTNHWYFQDTSNNFKSHLPRDHRTASSQRLLFAESVLWSFSAAQLILC